MIQQPDNQPGNYYVSVVDGRKHSLLLGPFNNHQAALDMVEPVRKKANELDRRAWFYGFGTARIPLDLPAKPGILNDLFPDAFTCVCNTPSYRCLGRESDTIHCKQCNCQGTGLVFPEAK